MTTLIILFGLGLCGVAVAFMDELVSDDLTGSDVEPVNADDDLQ